ncbi:MAG: VCBS repeat-containing protein, partial [Planctomycetes bacterium]|nr:VCBS repeat-containing protein [Planctomycetota bacterium]
FALQPGKSKGVTIDYGKPGAASGAGIYMWITDLDGNGFDDIIAPGKEGLYLFWNQGPKKPEHPHQH